MEANVKEKIGVKDIGNGLIILGLVLFFIYLVLLFASCFLYAESNWKVWSYPAMLHGTATAVLVLIGVGILLRLLFLRGGEAEDIGDYTEIELVSEN